MKLISRTFVKFCLVFFLILSTLNSGRKIKKSRGKITKKHRKNVIQTEIENNYQYNVGQYVLLTHLLGKGAFGETFLALKLNQNIEINKENLKNEKNYEEKLFAVKRMDKTNKKNLKNTEIEIKIVEDIKQELGSDILTQHFGLGIDIIETESNAYLTMNHNVATLTQVLRKTKLTFEMKIKIIYQIALGIFILHAKKISHNDLKPDNIMFNSHGNVILIDFGLSKMNCDNQTGNREASGTLPYLSPENFNDEVNRGLVSDNWSFAAIVYEIITGEKMLGTITSIVNVFLSVKSPKFISSTKTKFLNALEQEIGKYDKEKLISMFDTSLMIDPTKRGGIFTILACIRLVYLEIMKTQEKITIPLDNFKNLVPIKFPSQNTQENFDDIAEISKKLKDNIKSMIAKPHDKKEIDLPKVQETNAFGQNIDTQNKPNSSTNHLENMLVSGDDIKNMKPNNSEMFNNFDKTIKLPSMGLNQNNDNNEKRFQIPNTDYTLLSADFKYFKDLN